MSNARSPNIEGLSEDGFMANVIPEPNTGCWLFVENIQESGYAILSWRGRSTGAHRWAWALFCGPIPDGLHIDHLCNVRCCVNPDHLEIVTPIENNKRIKPRLNKGKRAVTVHLWEQDWQKLRQAARAEHALSQDIVKRLILEWLKSTELRVKELQE